MRERVAILRLLTHSHTCSFPMVTLNSSPRHRHLALASQVASLTTFKCWSMHARKIIYLTF